MVTISSRLPIGSFMKDLILEIRVCFINILNHKVKNLLKFINLFVSGDSVSRLVHTSAFSKQNGSNFISFIMQRDSLPIASKMCSFESIFIQLSQRQIQHPCAGSKPPRDVQVGGDVQNLTFKKAIFKFDQFRTWDPD